MCGGVASLIHRDSGLSVSGSGRMSGAVGHWEEDHWVLLHLVVELGVQIGVHLIDDGGGGRVVDQEEADLLQALVSRSGP